MECLICNKVYKNKRALATHLYHTHKISSEEYTFKYIYSESIPKCKCGCGETVSYCKEVPFTYREFSAPGHYVYYNPDIWGDKSNPERVAKGAATYKKMYAEGQIKHWSKGETKETNDTLKKYSELFKKENNPERADKISKKLKGKKKSAEHVVSWKSEMNKHWESEDYRKKLSDSRFRYLINSHKHYTSKLESYFEEIFLKNNKVNYVKPFYVKELKKFYDFYIPSLNIIIETDGDFWHCNPKKFPDVTYKCQKENLIVDKTKNDWAKKNNITLLRFWEDDIYNNESMIMESLKKYCIIP